MEKGACLNRIVGGLILCDLNLIVKVVRCEFVDYKENDNGIIPTVARSHCWPLLEY